MADLPPGAREIDGKRYMLDANGSLVPEEVVKPADKLLDEFVRKIIALALPLSAQVLKFRLDTLEAVDDFIALLEQEYGAKRG